MNLIDWVREFRGVTEGYIKFTPSLRNLGGSAWFRHGVVEAAFGSHQQADYFSLQTQNLDWHTL